MHLMPAAAQITKHLHTATSLNVSAALIPCIRAELLFHYSLFPPPCKISSVFAAVLDPSCLTVWYCKILPVKFWFYLNHLPCRLIGDSWKLRFQSYTDQSSHFSGLIHLLLAYMVHFFLIYQWHTSFRQ